MALQKKKKKKAYDDCDDSDDDDNDDDDDDDGLLAVRVNWLTSVWFGLSRLATCFPGSAHGVTCGCLHGVTLHYTSEH